MFQSLTHYYIKCFIENNLENHILSNKVTVTALCREGVFKTVVGKGKRNHLLPILHALKHDICIKNALMSLNIVLEGYQCFLSFSYYQ